MKAVACIGVLAAVQLLAGVEGHGHVKQPPSRVLLCNKGRNKGCWNTQASGVQNTGRFPNNSPFGDFDGVIASAMMATYRELDEQGENRWVKTRMRSGTNKFIWRMPANHLTKDFRYWITKQNWDPNAPLRVSSFENKPFCRKVVDGKPPREVTHRCNVPKRTGYQIILAEWKIGDTKRTFYNVIDLDFSGNGGGGNGPSAIGLQPLTRYHNRNIRRGGAQISKYHKKGLLCIDGNDKKGCKRNVAQNKLRWNPKKKQGTAPKPKPNKPAPKQQKCLSHPDGHELCKGREGCCTKGNKCFAYDGSMSVCLSTCPADWECGKQSSCKAAGGWLLCKGDESCCPKGTKCHAFNNYYSMCMAKCLKGWACDY